MKRLAAALAILIALFSAPNGAARAQNWIIGDLDGDGVVSAADAAKALRVASGAEALGTAAAIADVTGNMEIGGGDAQAILLLASGGISAFTDLSTGADGGLLGERHLGRFSYRGAILKDDGYRSDRVGVFVSRGAYESFAYVLADVYVQSIESMRTAFGGGAFRGGRAHPQRLAIENGAILAVNGDDYAAHPRGPLVRNGTWYRETIDRNSDVCVLYRDGRLATYGAGSVAIETIQAGDPYQSWTCGPRLLDEAGAALTRFAHESSHSHSARTVIGYYEPGHYCFVVVDGRQNPASQGASLPELAALMEALGCKTAYSLAGGNNSVMATQNKILNTTKGGERAVSDIFYLCEPVGRNGGA